MASTPYGDHWRNLRRIGAIEIFSTKRLNAFTESRRDEVKRLLLKLSENSIQNFSKVKLQPMFEELTFNIVMRMVAGKRYYGDEVADEEEAMKFRETVKEAAAHGGAANPGDFLPVLNWVGLNGYEKSVVSLAKRMDELLQGLIDEQRRKKEEGKNTMIDHLLCLQESQPDYYNDKIIKGLILVMLLAGIDTSSVTLEWAMCNLLNHPSVLRKARAELDSQIGQERLVTELDMSNLPYLQGIISETLRLYPAAPLLLPHFSSDDCTVGEYDIPRGTIVLFNAWAMHRDPDLWTDPTSFNPERHGIDQENNSRMDSSVHKFIPFGLGRRACPGSGMAQRIVGLGLGSLIQCFEWERVSDEEIDMTEGKGLTMPKAVTLEAMCKIRPIMHKILKDTSNGV